MAWQSISPYSLKETITGKVKYIKKIIYIQKADTHHLRKCFTSKYMLKPTSKHGMATTMAMRGNVKL